MPDELLTVLLLWLPFIGFGVWALRRERKRREDRVAAGLPLHSSNELAYATYTCAFDWGRLASELGLRYLEPGQGSGGRLLVGARDGLGIALSELAYEEGRERDASRALAIEVDGRGLIPVELALRPERTLDALAKVVAGEDVLSGDAAFDRRAHVQGPEDAVLAALREPARRALLPLVTGHRATVREGVLRVELTGIVEHAPLARLVRGMVEAARSLCVESVPDALADGARADPDPEVRLKSLQALLRVWREHEAARRAARAALIDANPRARLAAARLLADGPSAAALKQVADDAAVPAEVRIGALETLLELRPDFLAEALRNWAGDAALAEEAARALGIVGDASAEPALLELLSNPHSSVRAAAMEALGRLGTVAAVQPLLSLIESGRLPTAARDSIRRIQSRLGDVEAGRLSVALEQSPAGAVSLMPEPDAAPSLTEQVKD